MEDYNTWSSFLFGFSHTFPAPVIHHGVSGWRKRAMIVSKDRAVSFLLFHGLMCVHNALFSPGFGVLLVLLGDEDIKILLTIKG